MAVAAKPYSVRRFTVGEYYQLAAVGILGEDDPVELIEGEIVMKSPISSRHAACVKRLNALLTDNLQGRAIVSVQDPIRLSEHSEPEPDLALLKPREDFYSSQHPTSEDVLLVVEVAETSLKYDKEVKLPLYARHGIPEVWLLDLEGGKIEVLSEPEGEHYKSVKTLMRGDRLVLSRFSGVELAVEEIL